MHAQASAPAPPKIRQPALFKGDMGFAVDDWIAEMVQQFAYYGTKFPDDQARVRFAVSYFAGHALQWWQRDGEQAGIVDWASFVACLHARFRPVQASMVARQKLDKLRQKGGQSVNLYAHAFQTTLTPVDDMGAMDQVHHFVNGLLPHIAGKVWERHPKDLRHAIDYAVSVEAMGNFGRNAAPSSYGAFGGRAASSSGTGAPMDINHVSSAYEENDDADGQVSESTSAPSALDPVSALILSRLEGMDKRINALAHGGSASRSGGSSATRGDDRVPGLKSGDVRKLQSEGRCFRCKQKGHMKRDCDKPSSFS